MLIPQKPTIEHTYNMDETTRPPTCKQAASIYLIQHKMNALITYEMNED
jgi:hypothetical protein